jgi:alkylhydroperoxidase family enzyme
MSEAVALPAAQVECSTYCQCTDCVAMLQLSMLDGKKFAALHETGEDMASCELFLTPKVTFHTTSLSTTLRLTSYHCFP